MSYRLPLVAVPLLGLLRNLTRPSDRPLHLTFRRQKSTLVDRRPSKVNSVRAWGGGGFGEGSSQALTPTSPPPPRFGSPPPPRPASRGVRRGPPPPLPTPRQTGPQGARGSGGRRCGSGGGVGWAMSAKTRRFPSTLHHFRSFSSKGYRVRSSGPWTGTSARVFSSTTSKCRWKPRPSPRRRASPLRLTLAPPTPRWECPRKSLRGRA